jgi:ABC-2 type transport system permease protein
VRSLLAVARKELRQIRRDRQTLLVMAFVPVFFLLLYGYALNFDIRHIAMAVEDRDHTPESRALVSSFVSSGYFELVATVYSTREAERLLDQNDARAILVIPEGYSRDLRTGITSPVQVIVNGDNANTATTVIGYASSILRAVRMPGASDQAPAPINVEPRIWYNPELRSTLFLVPGLIAYITMLMAVTSTALAIVREKETGTIEQVRMAPIGTFPFIAGKAVPHFLIALASGALVFGASRLLFGLPMRGSWLTLALALSLYLVGALATGLLVSTIADTQQVAFQIALLVSMLPTLMLSGFIFPIASMPVPLQVISHAIPARYFLEALRGIVLKGTSGMHLLPEFVALVIYASAALGLASVRLGRERA